MRVLQALPVCALLCASATAQQPQSKQTEIDRALSGVFRDVTTGHFQPTGGPYETLYGQGSVASVDPATCAMQVLTVVSGYSRENVRTTSRLWLSMQLLILPPENATGGALPDIGVLNRCREAPIGPDWFYADQAAVQESIAAAWFSSGVLNALKQKQSSYAGFDLAEIARRSRDNTYLQIKTPAEFAQQGGALDTVAVERSADGTSFSAKAKFGIHWTSSGCELEITTSFKERYVAEARKVERTPTKLDVGEVGCFVI